MAMKISGLFSVFLLFGLSMSVDAQRLLGGYRSVAVHDAGVVAAAEFAVNKRAETADQEGLKLSSIEKAETQSASGSNYRLCMVVSMDDETQSVRAVVHRNLQQDHTLRTWDVVDSCNPAVPGDVGALTATPPEILLSCTGKQLKLSETDGDADMGGKRYGNYVFTNISSTSCSLSGYPKFAVLNSKGQVMRAVGVTYDHDIINPDSETGGKRPPKVTLDPGQTAWFQIFYNDGMALDTKKPFPVSARVRVTAPNDKRAFVLKSSFQVCCGVQVSSIRGGLPQ